MNDQELDKLLKSARVPERAPGHWSDVSKKITAKLHWQERVADHHGVDGERRTGLPLWVFGLTGACAAILFAVILWKPYHIREVGSAEAFASAEKCYREIQEMFPNQVRAIILPEHGSSRLDLADTASVPDTQPIFLKICGPGGCETVITFSGQRVRVGGEECDVLASGSGGVIVAGAGAVWSSDSPAQHLNRCRIEARQLKSS